MNFDLLDEPDAMVKSNLHFENIYQTGLTGLVKRSDRFAQIDSKTFSVPISVVNICPPVSW